MKTIESPITEAQLLREFLKGEAPESLGKLKELVRINGSVHVKIPFDLVLHLDIDADFLKTYNLV